MFPARVARAKKDLHAARGKEKAPRFPAGPIDIRVARLVLGDERVRSIRSPEAEADARPDRHAGLAGILLYD